MDDNVSDSDESKYDLLPKSCYSGNEPVVCIRIGILLALILLTTSCLIIRIIQYHCYKNRQYSHYFVMYTGLLIMLLLFIHTVYFPDAQWDFTDLLLIAVQLLSIFLYYSFWAFRLLKQETLFLYGVVPIFVVLTFGYIGLFVWAILSVTDDSYECKKPQWLIFSISQFVIVQCLLATVIYISCKLNNIRTVRTNRWSQKAQLTFIVTVYEIIVIMMLIYDIYLIAHQGKHCNSAVVSLLAVLLSGIVSLLFAFCIYMQSKNKGVLVFIEIFLKFLRFLVPQFAIVIIFAPLKPRRSSDPEDAVEPINDRYYYPPLHTASNGGPGTDTDPLIYPIRPPSLKPSSPEEHYPSLPKHGTYSSTSGYNFYQFRPPNTSVN